MKKRKKYGRSQRPYQYVKHQISNVLTPDELVAPFKSNLYRIFTGDSVNENRFQLIVFGIRANNLTLYENLPEVASQFRQFEILSGKNTVYMFNQSTADRFTLNGDNRAYHGSRNSTGVVAYMPFRVWEDYDGEMQREVQMFDPLGGDPIPGTKTGLWERFSEVPGVQIRFVRAGPGVDNNMQKLKFTASQNSFKRLKANKTGFQANITTEDPGAQFGVPNNAMAVDLMFDLIDATQQQTLAHPRMEVFESHEVVIRFKGRRTLGARDEDDEED